MLGPFSFCTTEQPEAETVAVFGNAQLIHTSSDSLEKMLLASPVRGPIFMSGSDFAQRDALPKEHLHGSQQSGCYSFPVGAVKGESEGSAMNSPCIPGLVCHAPPRVPKAALAPGDSQDHRVLSSVAWP